MSRSRLSYERAFESHLARCRLPYVSIDQARRALMPPGARCEAVEVSATGEAGRRVALKSFDFVIYGRDRHFLVEVKGRRASAPARGPSRDAAPQRRLECWATLDDVASLRRWEALFGPPFFGLLVFLYGLAPGDDGSGFAETFEHQGRRFGVLCVEREAYAAAMRIRSPRWRTVDLPAHDYALVSGLLLACAGPRPALPAVRAPVAS